MPAHSQVTSVSRTTQSPISRATLTRGCPCQDSWRILLAGVIALLLIMFCLTGCGIIPGTKKSGSSSSAATNENAGSFNLMITQKTGLNKLGPDQTTPPETYLNAGTRIRLIQSMGTSVEIETISGERGFVSSSDVGPLMQ